jgi:transposase, IS5 family
MIKKQQLSSCVSEDVRRRISKRKFFQQINELIDWSCIEKELYKVCKCSVESVAGRPAYNASILFKMMLLQTWYNLSDMGVEEMVNENLFANAFCGLQLADTVPNPSTPSRFRSELSQQRALPRLLAKINEQRSKRNVLVQEGSIIDASLFMQKPQSVV